MLEIITTDEFAAWFHGLEDGAAEEVATAMEMMEKLGPERSAPGSSEWLLWYEHRDAPETVIDDDWADFHDSAKEVVARLESPEFAQKLRGLPREEAGRVMMAIESLKMATAVRRRGLALMGAIAAAQAKGRSSFDAFAKFRESYRAVAAATGLAVSERAAHSPALRELSVCSPSARFRILYGVDLRSNVALAVLGERLERSFYGDSVRRAERVWQQFLQRNTEAREGAPRTK